MPDVSVTWLGHASFRVDSPGGKRIYIDPWLSNPKCPDGEKEPERVDVIALTHGHNDHVGETVELGKQFTPEIVANVELKGWLGEQGAPVGEVPGFNKGGTVVISNSTLAANAAVGGSGGTGGFSQGAFFQGGIAGPGAGLGGEKSGHVIVLEHTTSGDGIVTALEILRVMTRTGTPIADLASRIPLLPQQQQFLQRLVGSLGHGLQPRQTVLEDVVELQQR